MSVLQAGLQSEILSQKIEIFIVKYFCGSLKWHFRNYGNGCFLNIRAIFAFANKTIPLSIGKRIFLAFCKVFIYKNFF